MADPVLTRLEDYYDLAPRVMADTEQVGPFTLFVARSGWPYYARPRLGLAGRSSEVTAEQVGAVLSRQRELGVPRAVEWVDQTTPSLYAAAVAAGMRVERCPLLVLDPPVRRTDAATQAGQEADPAAVRRLFADDPDLAAVVAAVGVAFDHAGTATGPASVAERDEALGRGAGHVDATRAAISAGATVQVGVFLPGVGAVGGGAHNPRGQVSEVVGVGVLPAFRRRGLAAAVTADLVDDALRRGVTTVFCSAASQEVARVYQGIGFRPVGTACVAEAD
ncbi:MAG TPA: GNAT family N-acetyltransferase [Dermatophilaceae bacterium]|nr:GNAT family N-acetyltransferase [Dermatophilaceae bacterium]